MNIKAIWQRIRDTIGIPTHHDDMRQLFEMMDIAVDLEEEKPSEREAIIDFMRQHIGAWDNEELYKAIRRAEHLDGNYADTPKRDESDVEAILWRIKELENWRRQVEAKEEVSG